VYFFASLFLFLFLLQLPRVLFKFKIERYNLWLILVLVSDLV